LKVARRLIAAIVAAVFFFGCGGTPKGQPSSPGAKADSSAVVDPTTAASIEGSVFLDGQSPTIQPIDMGSDPACAQANVRGPYQESVAIGDNAALANVVVYVEGGFSKYRFDSPRDPAVFEQKDCRYAPRIVALMTNQPLLIRNEDTTIHNVHAMPKKNGEWSKAQRAGGAALQTSFSRPELAIPLMCNVHPWMKAFVFVFDNPYYSVTTREGRFALRNLPPGTYAIQAWQERFGTQSQTVTVGPRESKTISFWFKSDQVSD
jgi:hypothetical protein